MERPCAWPTLYLEINVKDDDIFDKFDFFCFVPEGGQRVEEMQYYRH